MSIEDDPDDQLGMTPLEAMRVSDYLRAAKFDEAGKERLRAWANKHNVAMSARARQELEMVLGHLYAQTDGFVG